MKYSQVNHPGLVYKVTELFFARGLRVETLHTDTKIAPFGGTVLFLMDGTIVADKVNSLRSGFALQHLLNINHIYKYVYHDRPLILMS